jgi:hypothetical protein
MINLHAIKLFRKSFACDQAYIALGADYTINVGRLGGGSLASSYGGDINIGDVGEFSHVREFGK